MPDPRAVLAAWGLEAAPCRLVATRENTVYRIETPRGPAALRLRRPGYRTKSELVSELDWMAALSEGGLHVPAPIADKTGSRLVETADGTADLVSWIDGQPMGVDGELSDLTDGPAAYFSLGQIAATLHDLCDAWQPPDGFSRPAWDADGLLGETPLWGRFWENPLLSDQQKSTILAARDRAAEQLGRDHAVLDYGLIHADLTPENVILTPQGPALIDFDDGGWGYRAFELATAVNRAHRAPNGNVLSRALIEGYQSRRRFDERHLPLFRLLRAFTYLGWIVPRMGDPGAETRAHRFAALATSLADQYLATKGA